MAKPKKRVVPPGLKKYQFKKGATPPKPIPASLKKKLGRKRG